MIRAPSTAIPSFLLMWLGLQPRPTRPGPAHLSVVSKRFRCEAPHHELEDGTQV
jgi:hypothetical protein